MCYKNAQEGCCGSISTSKCGIACEYLEETAAQNISLNTLTRLILIMQVEHIMSEKEILLTLSKDPHPFVVNLVTTFNDEKYIYMVLDYIIGGEFFTHLRNAGTFDSSTAAFYSASVVLVFDSLHCKDIIYRDLKPEVRYVPIVLAASRKLCALNLPH